MKLANPNKLTRWFTRPDGGNNFFKGDEDGPSREEYVENLVCLGGWPEGKERIVSVYITGVLVPWFQEVQGSGVCRYCIIKKKRNKKRVSGKSTANHVIHDTSYNGALTDADRPFKSSSQV